MFSLNAAFAHRVPLLYLVTDNRAFDTAGLVEHVRRCLDGGVDVVQYRDKTSSDDMFEVNARRLLDLTTGYGVPLVINDRVHIARRIGAPSIHVGRKDGRLEDLTMGLDEACFVGWSVDADNLDDPIPPRANLIGAGPVWPTQTKKDAAAAMGIDVLRKIIAKSQKPVVAIGGLTKETVRIAIREGCVGAAIVGELMDAENPTATAKELKALMVDEFQSRQQR